MGQGRSGPNTLESVVRMGPETNRFDDFFETDRYVSLKNHLYNYRLRKRAIENIFRDEPYDRILEVGSGISPVMTQTDRIVYSELSFQALRALKHSHGRGCYVVADAMRLPFRTGAFSHTVCSEVLEHLPDDRAALGELARVTAPGGRLIVTFPHQHWYFTVDDQFVNHFRRYELPEMERLLEDAGMRKVAVRKVLGPLEKITSMVLVVCFSLTQREGGKKPRRDGPSLWWAVAAKLFQWANGVYSVLVYLDARMMPRALATVLLIVAEKPGNGAARDGKNVSRCKERECP